MNLHFKLSLYFETLAAIPPPLKNFPMPSLSCQAKILGHRELALSFWNGVPKILLEWWYDEFLHGTARASGS